MTVSVLALSISGSITKYGAYAGFASIVGLAVLSLLYFAQAREVRRLREWAGRAPERAAELEQRVSEEAAARVRPAAAPRPVVPVRAATAVVASRVAGTVAPANPAAPAVPGGPALPGVAPAAVAGAPAAGAPPAGESVAQPAATPVPGVVAPAPGDTRSACVAGARDRRHGLARRARRRVVRSPAGA